jgi:hypothetical protein
MLERVSSLDPVGKSTSDALENLVMSGFISSVSASSFPQLPYCIWRTLVSEFLAR